MSTHVGATTLPDRSENGSSAEVAVDLTTELRWFMDGRLPTEVVSWFDRRGAGLAQQRCDTYRVDGRLDSGVKCRFGTTPELKLRLRPPLPFQLGPDMHGQMEIWRRWSPAGDRVDLTGDSMWVEIGKSITKRRFGEDGREIRLSEANRAMTGHGCDAEIAALSVNGHQAWTFALAAFGPSQRHEDLLRSAWTSLNVEQACPHPFDQDRDRSCGFPEWMAEVVARPVLDDAG